MRAFCYDSPVHSTHRFFVNESHVDAQRQVGPGPIAWLAGVLVLVASGCFDYEEMARAYLRDEGLVDVKLEALRDEGSFSYTARRGREQCVGRLLLHKERGSRSISDRVSCQPDEASCWEGHAGQCHRLGRIYDEGDDDPMDPTPQDLTRAAAFYDKACGAGHGPSCNIVGLRYADGRGVPADPERAVVNFRRSCDLAHGRGCYNLGLSYSYGRGVAKDGLAAARYYRWACYQGVAASCYNLAVAYRDGIGVAAEPSIAAGLFAQACELGYLQSCVNLGVMHAVGDGAIEDTARAAALFRKACDGGLATGCAGLRKLDEAD